MGTRRSRHNKGRKPIYKETRLVASHLIAHPIYPNLPWWNSNFTWSDADQFKLDVFCESDTDVEQAADVLKRRASSLCYKARDLGLTLPSQWARLITPKRKLVARAPTEQALQYPYIRKARAEHVDILAINDVVPKGIGGDMRADICQEIMVAILEGRTTLDALRAKRASVTYFIKKFTHDNFEQDGRAISFSAEDDRAYDEAASAIAARDWRYNEMNERRLSYDAMTRIYTPPTQFQAAFRDQVGRAQLKYHELGQFLSFEEVEELLDDEP